MTREQAIAILRQHEASRPKPARSVMSTFRGAADMVKLLASVKGSTFNVG